MSLFDLLTEEQQEERLSCCLWKVRYYSEDDARRAMRRLQNRGEKKPLHVYPCPYCGGFHVGGCCEQQAEKTRIIDGYPFSKVSVKHGTEDVQRHFRLLQSKGYWVKVLRQTRKHRVNYHIYAYHPIRDAVQQVQGVTA